MQAVGRTRPGRSGTTANFKGRQKDILGVAHFRKTFSTTFTISFNVNIYESTLLFCKNIG